MDDQLEDLFRQRLDGHEEEPPAGAWSRIQEDIKPVRKPKAIAGWLLAALLLLSLGTAVLFVKLYLPDSQLADGIKNQGAATEKQVYGSGTSGNKASSTGTSESIIADQTPSITENSGQGGLEKANQSETQEPASSKNQGNATENNTGKPADSRNKTNVKTNSGTSLLAQQNGILQNINKARATRNRKPNALALAGTKNGRSSTIKAKGTTPAEGKNTGTARQNSAGNNTSGTDKNQTENGGAITSPIAIASPETAGKPADPKSAEGNPIASVSENGTAADPAQKEAVAKADSVATPQEEKAEESTEFKKSTRFGFFAGSQLSYRNFAPNTKDDLYIKELKNKDKNYPERINVTAGALVQRSLTPRIALEAGLGMVYARDKIEFEATSGETTPLETSFTTDGLSLTTTQIYRAHKTENTAMYTTVRTGAVLSVLQSSFASVSLSGGGLLNVLSWNKSEATIDGKEYEKETYNPNRLQSGVYAGLRFSSPLSRRLDLAIEPGLNYFFNSAQKQDQPFQIRTHTYNVNVLFYLR